jgi:dihydropteroate synthase
VIRLRPIPDPDAPADAPRIAGGWVRFTRVELLERGRAPEHMDFRDIHDDDLVRLSDPRPPVAGLAWDAPRLMGILNVTPDSFSDGGDLPDADAVAARAAAMEAADILDIGGESTRPGAAETPPEIEAARVAPALAALAGRRLSVDTRKASVARAGAEAGAVMINDVSGGTHDAGMLAEVARSGAALCLMHMRGTPATMGAMTGYDDVLHDVIDALEARVAAAVAAGVRRDRIVVDPGIGFAKDDAQNLALIRRIGALHDLGLPVMLGVSRKGTIGRVGGAPRASERMPGTLALTLAAVAQGVQLHRVHDVAEVAQGIALWRAAMEGL